MIDGPAHVTPADLLGMMHYCLKVTHLSLPRYTQLSLDQLEEILRTMTHLEQLEVFISSINCRLSYYRSIIYEKLLKVTTASIKNLTLKFDWEEGENSFHYVRSIEDVMYALEGSIQSNHPLGLDKDIFYLSNYDHYGKASKSKIL